MNECSDEEKDKNKDRVHVQIQTRVNIFDRMRTVLIYLQVHRFF